MLVLPTFPAVLRYRPVVLHVYLWGDRVGYSIYRYEYGIVSKWGGIILEIGDNEARPQYLQ